MAVHASEEPIFKSKSPSKLSTNLSEHGHPQHHSYLHSIFNKYGNNGLMTFEGFEHLLENLGIGNVQIPDHDIRDHYDEHGFKELHVDHNHTGFNNNDTHEEHHANHHDYNKRHHNDHDHNYGHNDHEHNNHNQGHSEEHESSGHNEKLDEKHDDSRYKENEGDTIGTTTREPSGVIDGAINTKHKHSGTTAEHQDTNAQRNHRAKRFAEVKGNGKDDDADVEIKRVSDCNSKVTCLTSLFKGESTKYSDSTLV